MPVVTRWGTWIEAAIYYADNFSKIESIVNSFDASASESIRLAQAIIANSSKIKIDLAFIKANFSCISVAQTQLQTRGASITEAIGKFDAVGMALRSIRKTAFYDKFNMVATKNKGLAVLKKITDAIDSNFIDSVEEEDENMHFIKSLTPIELACYKFAPVTSSDVERIFSKYKHILNEKRRSFTFENLIKHAIINCNKFD